MANIIPFANFTAATLPALFADLIALNDDGLKSGGIGFPVLSFKGKVWRISRSGDKTLITKEDGEPAPYIEVVVVKGGPAGGRTAKVYYDKKYVEGSDEEPTCYSNNGLAPEADAKSPQCKTCAACPHNVWGARITESGNKGKACGDSKRLAVAQADSLGDPMLLRVPADSLKGLSAYNDLLAKRGVPYQGVVTRVSFDPEAAHPKFVFKPIGVLDQSGLVEVLDAAKNSDVVAQIVGDRPVAGGAAAEFVAPEPEQAAAPAPEKAKPAAEKPKAKPAAAKPSAAPQAAAAPNDFFGDLDGVVKAAEAAPKSAVVVESAPDVVADNDLESALDAMLGGGFSDAG